MPGRRLSSLKELRKKKVPERGRREPGKVSTRIWETEETEKLGKAKKKKKKTYQGKKTTAEFKAGRREGSFGRWKKMPMKRREKQLERGHAPLKSGNQGDARLYLKRRGPARDHNSKEGRKNASKERGGGK